MNQHDHEDPMSLVSRLDAVMEAVQTTCAFCSVAVEVLPAAGTRHVLGVTHEHGCPLGVPEG